MNLVALVLAMWAVSTIPGVGVAVYIIVCCAWWMISDAGYTPGQ